MTPGSLYASSDAQDAPLVRVIGANEDLGFGNIERGELARGAFLIEREHAYETASLRLFTLPAQDPRDQPLAGRVSARLEGLPGYVPSPSQATADLVLAVLRPKRVDGQLQYGEAGARRDALPGADQRAAPELWVLTPGEALLSEHLQTRLAPPEAGLETVAHNLDLYRRQTDLRRLAAQTGPDLNVAVHLIPCASCPGPGVECVEAPSTRTWHRPEEPLPIESLGARIWPQGTLLSYVIQNTGTRDRYVYLVELAPDGAVYPDFPGPGQEAAAALLKAGKRLNLRDSDDFQLLDVAGRGSLLVISTESPIDPSLFTQTGFEARRDAAMNPLERLLAQAITGTNRRSREGPSTGAWGAALVDYEVRPQGAAGLGK